MNLVRTLRTRFAIARLTSHIKQLAHDFNVPASVWWFGAYNIHPKHLAVIVCVDRDDQKEKLSTNPRFMSEFRASPAKTGYPAEGRDHVKFEVESQETVDRIANGSWYYRFK